MEELIECYKSKGEKNAKLMVGNDKSQPKNLSQDRKRKNRNDDYINFKIAKRFDDGFIYYGTIDGYNGEFWTVKYDDGDSEEFDANDVQMAIALYKTKNGK
jgi:hypothetical protein